MKVLAIGDVVGSIGCKFLRTQLPNLKKEKNIDLVIANEKIQQMVMVLLLLLLSICLQVVLM